LLNIYIAGLSVCAFVQVYNELATQKEELLANASTLQDDNSRLERELAALKEQTAEEALVIEAVEADCRAVEGSCHHYLCGAMLS
jgi:cell division protein FtsB